jgi:predicted Zn-dependent peptidase
MPSTLAYFFLFSQLLIYGRRIPIPELFARIDAVDASTVKRVANRFIFDQVIVILPAYRYGM